MHKIKGLMERIRELEDLLEVSERKADILTNLLKEANAEFERALDLITSSERNFRAVFQNAPEAIYIIDIDTRQILDSNSYTVNWLGYSREELLCMRVDDLVPEGGEDIPLNVRKAVEQGFVHVQERRYKTKDGTLVDAEVTGTLIEYEGKQCLAILVRDVTERKQLDELSRYKELFEWVGDPVFINDYEGNLLEVNEKACILSGYPRDALLSMRVRDLVEPDDRSILARNLYRLQWEETVKFELDLMTKSGALIPFEVHARLITYRGTLSVLSVARDLSVRKKLEETVIRTERLAAVGEMASGVAHNFNNLLQMMMGAGQAAFAKLDSGDVDTSREAIQALLVSCERGADIVRRIKEFTHAGSRELREARVFDLGGLVREAVELTRPLWSVPSHLGRYDLELSHRPHTYVKGKPSEIYEVLVNLIKNGLEAMPDGGVLGIRVDTENGRVRVQVSDTGTGIPKECLQRIFEPFFTTKGTKSSGLGLSSSYGIVRRHGGDILVQSTHDAGTTFTVMLPEAEEPRHSPEPEAESTAGDHVNLLVIDDEIHIIKAMELFFEDSGIRIQGARSGQEGLQIYYDGGIDVVLCDLGMDEMSGWDVGKAIKDLCRQSGVPKTPFVVYTGWDNGIDARRLEEHGIDQVVTKPMRMENLLLIIRGLLASKQRDQ